MSLNVLGLIQNIGNSFESIQLSGLIPGNRKIKPNFSGDDTLHLDSKREGVYLTFDRKTRKLMGVYLQLLIDEKPNYRFPNTLPMPLIAEMNLQWIRQTLGEPINSQEPRYFLKRWFGREDQYNLLKSEHGAISVCINYDMEDKVISVAFLPERLIFFLGRDGDRLEWEKKRGPIFED